MFNDTGALQRAELMLMLGILDLGDVAGSNDMGCWLKSRNSHRTGSAQCPSGSELIAGTFIGGR